MVGTMIDRLLASAWVLSAVLFLWSALAARRAGKKYKMYLVAAFLLLACGVLKLLWISG